MKSQELSKAKLPDTPGVYFFRAAGSGGDILYIGKATSLRDRTKSYFAKDLIATRGPLIVDMVFKADTVTYEETDSVLEALILEANLIKKHQPYYNTKEKDDKSWNYVCITDEALPKLLVERGKNIDFKNNVTASGVRIRDWYGPFVNGTQLKEALKIVRRIFPFIDASSAKRDNYEFYRQLGLTPDVSDEAKMLAYKRSIRNLNYFFQGKKKDIIKELEREMKMAAKEQNFEEASRIRNQIFSLGHINDIALLKGDATARKEKAGFRMEAYDVAHLSGKNMVGVMTVMEDGEINKKEYRAFNVRGFTAANDTGALEEILSRRLRHTEWGMPDLVIADGGEAQLRVARQVLDRYQLKIPVVSVVKDDRHKPKDILGDADMAAKHKKEILLANSEAHRFSITLHKKQRNKTFLWK
jgi:excinuclease ABC subunit C